MLGFAVRRNRPKVLSKAGATGPGTTKQSVCNDSGGLHLSSSSSFIICDSIVGYPIRHASQGFQDLLGYKASECVGEGFGGRQLRNGLQQSSEFKNLAKELGLNELEMSNSIQRMAQAADQAAQSAASDGAANLSGQRSPLLLATKKTGELFVCEISWRKNTHPSLGWSYHAGLLRDVSKISAARLLVAASQETTYQELCNEWADTLAPDLGLPKLSEKLGSSSQDMHAVAQKMWTDELTKETGKAKTQTRCADASSIWSRSTASTLASVNASTRASHHLGGIFARTDEHKELKGFESFCSAPNSEDFECETMSRSTSLSSAPPLFDEVVDRVKHVDRSGLRNMKSAFAIASASDGFPVALRSIGLEEMGSGPARKVRLGGDARQLFQPMKSTKARAVWNDFCESVSIGEFFNTGRGGTAQLENVELNLPAGEFAYVEQFQGKLGNPIDCLVYVKHVELDDCPYLLCLYSYLPDGHYNLEAEFPKVVAQVDGVVYELASEFFYHAPMHRQRNGDNSPQKWQMMDSASAAH